MSGAVTGVHREGQFGKKGKHIPDVGSHKSVTAGISHKRLKEGPGGWATSMSGIID